MAIAPTPNNNIFKGLVFDDIDSRDYGIYITGSAVFNSPERDVEMIEIPGRNGSYALDNGRFNNIEVTYPAGLFGGSEADFAAGIRAFRNALASRIGYKRLEDDYNPNEYRLAVYKSGLEVTPAQLKAGEFSITFECQPQRFLKSGETETAISSGGTINNPTLFDAQPLLKVKGNGTIGINGAEVNVVVAPLGRIVVNDNLWDASGFTASDNFADIDPNLYATGDTILINGLFDLRFYASSVETKKNTFSTFTSSDADATLSGHFTTNDSRTMLEVALYFNDLHFEVGTASTQTVSGVVNCQFGGSATQSKTQTLSVSYDGGTAFTFTITVDQPTNVTNVLGEISTGRWYIDSTVSTISDFLYIDLDIGEAYMYDASGNMVSINDRAVIPATLPALVPGANTITVEGAITELEIIPRWWEV